MKVYADHAATEPMRQEAKEAMIMALEDFGNPSSIHAFGRLASAKIESARKEIAELLNCRPAEIYFTSGGSEADNWAIHAARYRAESVVTSAFEHHAILHTLEAMEKAGTRQITVVAPKENGIIDPEEIGRRVNGSISMVTVMAANNEIGTLQPIQEISKEVRKYGNKLTVFHTDAVQAVGHIPIDVQKMGVDMLSLSAHKFGGPKGIGALYCRQGITPKPIMFGGGQERGHRPGTENVPAIIAMAAAMRVACENMAETAENVKNLRDRLLRRIEEIPGSRIHGDKEKRLPGNINCSFSGIEGETMALLMDLAGICVSTGSACTSGSGEPSHVLTALGLPRREAYGAIRISLGEENTEQEVDYIASTIETTVATLRKGAQPWTQP